MQYQGHRYLLYKRWDYAPHGRTKEQQEALDAGQALFKAANFEHWTSQPELVERVQNFLVSSIPSYRPRPYGDSPRDVIDALCWEVRNGAAVIVRAKPAYIAHDGFVPARTEQQRYRLELEDIAERAASYAARSKAYDEGLAEYHQEIEQAERASRPLEPFRHIETIAEAAARNRATWAALGAGASAGLSAVASSLPSIGDNGTDSGNVSGDGMSSAPLGNATPFKFQSMPSFGDSFDIAKTPNYGEPGTWYTNPGSGQMRLYGDTGAPVVDFDFDHDHGQGVPHAHNYGPVGADGAFDREGGRSFSLLPW